jgi:hypothetical protein
MQTKLYANKKVAEEVARTLKVCDPDFSYIVGSAASKPMPTRMLKPMLPNWHSEALEGYFCIRRYTGKDFHSFA